MKLYTYVLFLFLIKYINFDRLIYDILFMYVRSNVIICIRNIKLLITLMFFLFAQSVTFINMFVIFRIYFVYRVYK